MKKKKKQKNKTKITNIITRYAFLLLLSAKNLFVFYFIFTPLTIYPVAFFLGLFYSVKIYGIFLFVNTHAIEIIESCIAGSAYFLLFLLNLATPNINFLRRIKIFIFDFALLLILNIARIFILTIMFIKGSVAFDITHFVFWHLLSVIFVFCIWLLTIKVFRVREIPFWSDILYFKRLIRK